MRNEKFIRRGDSFLDDLINLFFLRPVYRDQKIQFDDRNESSTKEETKKTEGKTSSSGNISNDHPMQTLPGAINVPLPRDLFSIYLPSKGEASNLKLENNLTVLDAITNSGHVIEFKLGPTGKNYLQEEFFKKFKTSGKIQGLNNLSTIRFIHEIASFKESESIENQPPLMPTDQIPDAKASDDNRK